MASQYLGENEQKKTVSQAGVAGKKLISRGKSSLRKTIELTEDARKNFIRDQEIKDLLKKSGYKKEEINQVFNNFKRHDRELLIRINNAETQSEKVRLARRFSNPDVGLKAARLSNRNPNTWISSKELYIKNDKKRREKAESQIKARRNEIRKGDRSLKKPQHWYISIEGYEKEAALDPRKENAMKETCDGLKKDQGLKTSEILGNAGPKGSGERRKNGLKNDTKRSVREKSLISTGTGTAAIQKKSNKLKENKSKAKSLGKKGKGAGSKAKKAEESAKNAKRTVEAAGTAAAASTPVTLILALIWKKIKKDGKRIKDVATGEGGGSGGKKAAVAGGLALLFFFGLILGPMLILLLLFQLKEIPAKYSLKETVFLVEQEFHAELLEQVGEYYAPSGEDEEGNPVETEAITAEQLVFHNASLPWKNMLAYWYVTGIQDLGSDFQFFVDTKHTNMKDLVTNRDEHPLSEDETELLRTAFNDLNTVLVYPETQPAQIKTYDISMLTEAEKQNLIEELKTKLGLTEGVDFVVEETSILVYDIETLYIVDVEQRTALEAAEDRTDEEKQWIELCLRAVNENNRSLEPCFYDIWKYITATTQIDVTARDQLIEEAYAMWIMSGAQVVSAVPLEARDQYGVDSPLTYTIYRESADTDLSTEDEPFVFYYINNKGNLNLNFSWLNDKQGQSETDVPVFLREEYGWGVGYRNGQEEILCLRPGTGVSPTHPDLLCANYDWNAYCYHCTQGLTFSDMNYDRNKYAWCCAFLNTLAQGGRYRGCFFQTKEMFIDANHPSWAVYTEDTKFDESQTRLMTTLSKVLDSGNFIEWCANLLALLDAIQDCLTSWSQDSYINYIHLTGKTDYWRLNITDEYSGTKYGLQNGFTANHKMYAPAERDAGGYRPEEQDIEWSGWGIRLSPATFATISPTDSKGNPIARDKANGHEKGWYAPRMVFDSKFYEGGDYYKMYGCVGMPCYSFQAFLDGTVLADSIGMIFGDDNITPEIHKFMDGTSEKNYTDASCGIFSELIEERQFLFDADATYCKDLLNTYRTNKSYNATVFGPNDMSFDFYQPQAGDVIFYQWDNPNNPDDPFDHVGLIVWADEETGELAVIEGNAQNAVRMRYTNYKQAKAKGIVAIAQIHYGGGN